MEEESWLLKTFYLDILAPRGSGSGGGGGGVSYVCGSVKMMRILFHRGHLYWEG